MDIVSDSDRLDWISAMQKLYVGGFKKLFFAIAHVFHIKTSYNVEHVNILANKRFTKLKQYI